MQGLFPKLMAIGAALALSACVAAGPTGGKAAGPNPVTGSEIEVTSLDGPPAKAGPGKANAGKSALATPTAMPSDPPPPAVKSAEKTTQQTADQAGPKPKPRPEGGAKDASASAETVAAPAAAPVVPQAEKSAAQIACEKKNDFWATAGKSGAQSCIKRTRDGGKRCKKASQCSGSCLARSGTCSPYDPLFGCNEIFQADGSRVTLCID